MLLRGGNQTKPWEHNKSLCDQGGEYSQQSSNLKAMGMSLARDNHRLLRMDRSSLSRTAFDFMEVRQAWIFLECKVFNVSQRLILLRCAPKPERDKKDYTRLLLLKGEVF